MSRKLMTLAGIFFIIALLLNKNELALMIAVLTLVSKS